MGKMKRKMNVLMFVLLLIISFVLSTSFTMAAENEPIKIGFIPSTTGYIAGVGLDYVKGVNLAVEDLNNKGGILGRKIKVVSADSESSPTKATTIVRRFVYDDKVKAIIGPDGSHLAFSVTPIVEKEGIPMIVCTPSSRIWQGKKFTFSGTFQAKHFAMATASIIMHYLNLDSIGIIRGASEYGEHSTKGLTKVLKMLGDKVKVVGIEKYTSDTMDCSPHVMRIKNAGAKGLALMGAMPNVALKAVREIGWDIPIVVAPGATSKRFLKLTGKYAEGLIGTNFRGAGVKPEDQNPELRYMFKLYKKKYGSEPTLFSVIGWDSLKLYEHAIKTAKTDDPKKVRDALENIKGFLTAAGEVNMSQSDHSGRVVKDIGVVVAKDNKWVGLTWRPK